MSRLSSTITTCSKAARDIVASARRTPTRYITSVASVVVVGLALACSDNTQNPVAPTPSVAIPGPVFGSSVAGNGPGACLLKDTQDAAFINNVTSLNCTSNDVDISFAAITFYRINGGSFQALPQGQQIACVPGDQIDAVTSAFIANSANERYDFGLWINPVPDSSAYSGGSCLHFNLIPGSNGAVEIDETADQCGDIAGSDTVEIPLDTLHLTCPGGGATTLSVDACAAWSNGTTGANDRICPVAQPPAPNLATGFRWGTTPGTTAKCRCEPLVLPIDVKGVLRIEKQTLPDGSSQSFTFTPNYNGGTTFNLTDGQTNNSPPLSAGTYTAAETVPSGWSLTNRECHVTGTATAKTFTSITNGVSVALGAGEDITCVFTNTKIPTLTVNKVCAPTSDAGKFNLQIDASTAGTGANASCGGTTGAVEVTIGTHTAGETAGTATTLSNYTTVIGGDCASNGSVTLAAGDAKTCTITNTRKPTLTVNKVCVPTSDTGKFNLQIDASTAGTGADAACGGTTGAVIQSIGTHTAGETAGTGTVLTDYTTVIGGDCASNGSVTLAAGDNKTCTITNTRKARLTVNKVCVPTSDGGKFNLQIDAATAGTGANASCGGTTGAVFVSAATHTVGETAGTATTLSNYTTVITGDCASNGTVTLAAGDNKTCTITNTRKPTLTVNKVCVPTSDTGKFNLQIDGSTAGTGSDASCGGTTGAVVTSIGTHTAGETAGTGTSLTSYNTVIGGDCATNGSVTLAAGENKTCTITNTRKPGLTVNKVCVPTNDGGKFNLQVDGSTAGTGANASCGGTTGLVEASIGTHTVGETAGTATSLSDYVTVIGGDCASDGTVTLAAGQFKTCTITNQRKPRLTVNKACVPTSDAGKFNLQIDGATAGTGGDASCGGTTGALNQTVGTHTAGETQGTGTLLSNYTTVIGGDCASNGSVTLAYGDNKTCTITNTRKPTLRVNKVCVPTSDPGAFNLQIDASTAGTGANAACGGTTGVVVSSVGSHTVGETAGTNTDLTNYVSVIGGDCATNGSITLSAGQNAICTITNSRKAVLIVDKVLTGGGVQLFDFSQTGISNFQLADATTPKKTTNLLPGQYTVCELALAVAWNATFTVNGSSVTPTVNGTTGDACYQVTLNYGDSTTVVVTNTPPPGGGTRTIGYWKNWSSCAQSNGGQYDKAIAKGTPEATLDFYLNPAQTPNVYPLGDITSLTCLQAVNLLAKNAIDGSKRAGDPIYNMVAQMLGAKLNVAAQAGTCPALLTALADAQTFLDNLGFLGTGSYKGTLSASDQNLVNGWAGIFGSYNEGTLGGGCPTHI